MKSKPSRDEAIAFAQDLLRGQCTDYPGGCNGLLADIACLSIKRIQNLGNAGRKKRVVGNEKRVVGNT